MSDTYFVVNRVNQRPSGTLSPLAWLAESINFGTALDCGLHDVKRRAFNPV